MKSRCKLYIVAVASVLVAPGVFGMSDPLHEAVQKGDLDSVRRLIPSSNVNCAAYFGVTPLHSAACYGHKDVVELLLDSNACINGRNNAGETPLHYAVESDRKDVTEFLLSKGAAINACDNCGMTPLHHAIRYGCNDIAQLLLARDAKVNVCDNDRMTPMHFATMVRNKKMVRLLLENHADLYDRDRNCDTPLHYAARWVANGICHYRVSACDVVEALLDWLLLDDESGDRLYQMIHLGNNKGESVWYIADRTPGCFELRRMIDERIRNPKKYAKIAYAEAVERREIRAKFNGKKHDRADESDEEFEQAKRVKVG